MTRTRKRTAPEVLEPKMEVQVEKTVHKPNNVYTTTAALNLRSTAGDMSNDAIMVVIPEGTKIVGLGGEKDTTDGVHWLEVRYNKFKGWVNNKFVK